MLLLYSDQQKLNIFMKLTSFKFSSLVFFFSYQNNTMPLLFLESLFFLHNFTHTISEGNFMLQLSFHHLTLRITEPIKNIRIGLEYVIQWLF